MHARHLTLGFALAALALAPLPVAADLLELGWSSCAEIAAAPVKTFACDTNDGAPFDLIYSVNPFTTMPDVSGAHIRLWIQSSVNSLPSWWHVEEGGCRIGALTYDMNGPFPAGCTDPWLGAATVSASTRWLECRPDGIRIDLNATLPAGTSRTLVPGTRYAMFRVRISRAQTLGVGSCFGCTTSACFGVQGITIDSAGGPGGWSMSPGCYAIWQGTSPCDLGSNCDPDPVRRTTWGSIHSLYR